MGGRQAVNRGKAGRRRILDRAEDQEIADGVFVEVARHRRVQADTRQRVAEHQAVRHLGVEERLDAELIASAEEASAPGIPDGEDEVAADVGEARLTPNLVCVQEHTRVALDV